MSGGHAGNRLLTGRLDLRPVALRPGLSVPCPVRDLWPRAFIGQWGNHLVEPGDFDAVPDAIYVGLRDGAAWLGLFRAEPDRSHVDGPGFAGRRSGPRARALVLGACAQLGSVPVTLEAWGDRSEPCLALGFSIAEDCPGWELPLA